MGGGGVALWVLGSEKYSLPSSLWVLEFRQKRCLQMQMQRQGPGNEDLGMGAEHGIPTGDKSTVEGAA